VIRQHPLPSRQREAGYLLPTVLSVIIAGSIFAAAVLNVVLTNFFIVGNDVNSQKAFNIAEAGVNYYMWHLSHNSTDYKDGKTTPTTPDPILGYGPYVHTYIDSNYVNEGTFTLWVNPQGNGSTIVNVRSIGAIHGSSIVRTVQAQVGATSFANYGVLADTALWFGNNETADGPVFSNQGVRMDGPNTSTVNSANTTYVPPFSLGGDGASHPGVWCNSSVTSPINCNTRNKSSWVYPSTTIDFNQVSSSLCTIKKLAFASDSSTASLASQANACTQTPTTRTAAYIPQRNATYSVSNGYLIELNTNGTYDLYSANNENDTLANYTAALSPIIIATGITIPSSGVIFAEDNVWVMSNPTYHGRVTIAAGRLASAANTDIHVVNNLLYSTKNGADSIGLISKGNVYIAPYAAPAAGSFTLEIDAAVLAQSGTVEFPSNYNAGSKTCTRGWVNSNQTLSFYGSVSSRLDWTWSWLWGGSCGNNVFDPTSGSYISGFLYNTTHYDYNLLYAPPPSYPVTGGYGILSWREVLAKP
jgi:Tfp pilus assembly protein PilX